MNISQFAIVSSAIGLFILLLGIVTVSKRKSLILIIIGGILILSPTTLLDWSWTGSLPKVQAAAQPERFADIPSDATLANGMYYVLHNYRLGDYNWITIVHKAEVIEGTGDTLTIVKRHAREYPTLVRMSMWPPPMADPFIVVSGVGTNKSIRPHAFSKKNDYRQYTE